MPPLSYDPKVVGPDMAWICGHQAGRMGQSPAPMALEALDLKLMLAPQPSHPLLVHQSGASKQHADPSIAIAWVAGRQLADLCQAKARSATTRMGTCSAGRGGA
jgi:hypothetical protein